MVINLSVFIFIFINGLFISLHKDSGMTVRILIQFYPIPNLFYSE